MAGEVTFKGYAIKDLKRPTEFEIVDFTPKKFEETDIDVAITYCGVCGSDVHTITGGWSENVILPCITGHEITGKAVRVGSQVKGIQVGQRVGVGAQVGSCYGCKDCDKGLENYCANKVDTYNAKYSNGDIAHGGYSTAIRANERFVFPLPDGISDADCSSMMCAGLTVYAPLVRHGCKAGSKVAVVGIGGLGSYAIMFAKALGAEVSVLSHSDSKKQDALAMGASHFYAVKDSDLPGPLARSFDIIINTRNAGEGFPMIGYLKCLDTFGTMVQVGLPEGDLPGVSAEGILPNGCALAGSHIGSKDEALAMLKLAAEKQIKPWIEVLDMKDAGKAIQGVLDGKARYRYVLKQDLL